MSKYFLIHGYGQALIVGMPSIPQNGGFYTFDQEIHSGNAYPFVWALTYPRGQFTALSLIHQWRLYRQEQQYIQTIELQNRLYNELLEQQPQVIIAHSMGAQLLCNTLSTYTLPTSVQCIIFVQADVHRWDASQVSIPILNLYCWWDIALWSSSLLKLKTPYGLIPPQNQQIQSYFRGLYRGWNKHQDIWRDERYKADILTRITQVTDLLEDS